ncbi:PTS system cellobiose-specific IIB component [Breznakia sp. PF5-3]|uniref:PTS sugar transporter subunit IIB n=1 Tax=unclassified Breznakia TaxID=2623764 RepID=UPI0024070BBF|nr:MULTISPECIES: PTS sugar transporter subunit IIB [unclassified Breznakia]MDF9825705.1 PTS system cellobiose-specific IIB component [Breznakia sp. PM6-1]MDF9836533.1 PTS system cellobiose-specific IIB component [Breznakia sp. PF5-3]MDF9838767.1 PTS system cellobiose-specific IIB component [Breznakia sp. PFB2-8]MDF9860793.1 PTS system cellobiose-specific IIB component [Breznakia sp. PH5-24]
MEKIKVLLICGSGASSGFMATNISKAAKKKGIDISITARSKSEIDSYADSVDMIMIGPHMKHIKPEVEEKVEGKNVKVVVMKKSYYALLDGESALEHIQSKFEEKA